ncbi:MAG: hypothetical protein IJ485_06160 [Lachnospiraceae bacterium]|nr:hypothetical protein [Lachnospiraceae bacterium]
MYNKYLFNAGQTDLSMKGPELPMNPYTVVPVPEEPFPDFSFAPGFEDNVIVMRKHHELHGVTPKMLDWWWNNMEKGYYLWAPGHHKTFDWTVAPNVHGYVDSIESVHEQTAPGGPIAKIDVKRLDVDGNYPYNEYLPHVYIGEGTLGDIPHKLTMVHMYEAKSYGTRWITAAYCSKEAAKALAPMIPLFSESPHHDYEMAQFPVFLPKLYELWQMNHDPAQNVPCDLRVRPKEGGGIEYIAKNGPTVAGE